MIIYSCLHNLLVLFSNKVSAAAQSNQPKPMSFASVVKESTAVTAMMVTQSLGSMDTLDDFDEDIAFLQQRMQQHALLQQQLKSSEEVVTPPTLVAVENSSVAEPVTRSTLQLNVSLSSNSSARKSLEQKAAEFLRATEPQTQAASQIQATQPQTQAKKPSTQATQLRTTVNVSQVEASCVSESRTQESLSVNQASGQGASSAFQIPVSTVATTSAIIQVTSVSVPLANDAACNVSSPVPVTTVKVCSDNLQKLSIGASQQPQYAQQSVLRTSSASSNQADPVSRDGLTEHITNNIYNWEFGQPTFEQSAKAWNQSIKPPTSSTISVSSERPIGMSQAQVSPSTSGHVSAAGDKQTTVTVLSSMEPTKVPQCVVSAALSFTTVSTCQSLQSPQTAVSSVLTAAVSAPKQGCHAPPGFSTAAAAAIVPCTPAPNASRNIDSTVSADHQLTSSCVHLTAEKKPRVSLSVDAPAFESKMSASCSSNASKKVPAVQLSDTSVSETSTANTSTSEKDVLSSTVQPVSIVPGDDGQQSVKVCQIELTSYNFTEKSIDFVLQQLMLIYS